MNAVSTIRTKKARERFLVREFSAQHLPGFSVTSETDEHTGPTGIDCVVSNGQERISFEVTQYFIDHSSPQGSLGMQAFRTTEQALAQARKTCCETDHRFESMCVMLAVRPVAIKQAALADDVARFLLPRVGDLLQGETLTHFGSEAFSAFPALAESADSLGVVPGCGYWRAHGARFVDLLQHVVRERIEAKKPKAPDSERRGQLQLDACWLLIYAAPPPSESATGHGSPPAWELKTIECAQKSGFDRIIFWDRSLGWHSVLWQRCS